MNFRVIKHLKVLVPPKVREKLRAHMNLLKYDLKDVEIESPIPAGDNERDFPNSKYKLCIIREFFHYHRHYIEACKELNVSYKVIDISKHNWIEVLSQVDCDAFLVWPTAAFTPWRNMFDERLYVIEKLMNKFIYPTYSELWYYEYKQRLFYWLKVHNIPHPKTWVFYTPDEAIGFVEKIQLPFVIKLNTGASASGVWIIRDRKHGLKLVEKVFSKGLKHKRWYPMDKQLFSIIIQEYIPNFEEWRIARVGDSFVGYRKEKKGDFHSGSGAWSWLDPPREILDFVRDITDKYGITSMSFDIFRTENKKLLVSEMQTVFGATKPAEYLRVNGKFGRYIFDYEKRKWTFQEGEFCRNHLCNLRVEYLINKILPFLESK